jgi:hypothetical protein
MRRLRSAPTAGALEREEHRCRLYAEAMAQVANGAQQRRGGSPGAARVQRGTPGREEAPDLRRGLSSCLRGEHGTACYALALIGGCALPTLLLMALISTL